MEQAFYRTLMKEKLIKLKHVLPLIGENQKLFLDLKITNSCSNQIVDYNLFKESLSTLIANDIPNVFVILSDSSWLKKTADIWPVFYSTDNFHEGYNLLVNYPKALGMVIRNKAIDGSQIESIKSIDKEVYLFDIRSSKGIREALKKNPNGIITDDIRAALVYK
jgi:hypothetical protein